MQEPPPSTVRKAQSERRLLSQTSPHGVSASRVERAPKKAQQAETPTL